MNVTVGWGLAIALVALLALIVVTSRLMGFGLARPAVVSVLRAVLQLAVVSLLIAGALANIWLSLGFALLMFIVAVYTTASRVEVRDQWMWVALAVSGGAIPVLAVVFLSGAAPWAGVSLIPIAGIIIGNTMTGHTLMGRRCFTALRENLGSYEAALAIGLTRPQAIALVLENHRTEALVPILDNTRTVGLVTLPGAFVGVLLGGGSPVQAGAAQVLVSVGIMAAQFVTVALALWFIGHGKDLPADLREQIQA